MFLSCSIFGDASYVVSCAALYVKGIEWPSIVLEDRGYKEHLRINPNRDAFKEFLSFFKAFLMEFLSCFKAFLRISYPSLRLSLWNSYPFSEAV